MDLETRKYLKRLLEDYARAALIQSVLQRFADQMSPQEVSTLKEAALLLLAEPNEYLGIGPDGELIIDESDSDAEVPGDASMDDSTGDADEEPKEIEEQKPARKPRKEQGYT